MPRLRILRRPAAPADPLLRETWSGVSRRHLLIAVAGWVLAARRPARGQTPKDVFLWTFDQNPVDEPPLEWEAQAGRWVVRPEGGGAMNRVLVHTGPSPLGLDMPVILTPIVPVHDLTASVRFRRTGSGVAETMALVLRWYDAANMTLVTVEGSAGRIWVEQLRAGARRLLFGTAVAIPPERWHRLDVSALGERVAVGLDGRPLGTARDPEPAPGRVGLAGRPGAGMLLDDLEVVPLPDPFPPR